MKLRFVPVAEAWREVCSADLILYRPSPREVLGDLIARGGRSPYDHAGILERRRTHVQILEMIQFHGGRYRALEEAVRADRGAYDVFALDPAGRWPTLTTARRDTIVNVMRRFMHQSYGWWHLLQTAALHLPLIRALVPVPADDDEADRHMPFCSEAAAIAYQAGGGVDPVPLLPHRLTEPGDLARSLLFEYSCTLSKD